jgi:PAS domain S-box-containing protein
MTETPPLDQENARLSARLRLLSMATLTFGEAALDYERLLATVVRLVAEQVGDFCQIRLVSQDGKHLVSAAVHDADPKVHAAIEQQLQSHPIPLDSASMASRVLHTGEPLLASEITPSELRSGVPPELWSLLERFPPTSLIIVPLKARARTMGLLYIARRGGLNLDRHDLELAWDLAQRAAIVIDNARMFRDLRERAELLESSERRFSTTLSAIRDAVVAADDDMRVSFLNPHAERLTGWSLEEACGKPLDSIFELRDERSGERVEPSTLRDVAQASDGVSTNLVLVSRDSEHIPVESSASAISDGGPGRGVVLVFRDATDSRAAGRRRRFLAEASAILLASLDYEQTLRSIANVAVPAIADWCVVDLVKEGGGIDRVAIAHADPSKRELAAEYQRRYPPERDGQSGVFRVIESGQPELATEIRPEQVEALADPEQRRIVQSLGLRSYAIVPLVARGRTLGAMTCISAESGRRYRERDVELFQELANRIANAVDNSRLFKLSQESVAARDEFLSIASHELRTPLTPLGLQLEMLEQSLSRLEVPPSGALRKLEIARRQVDRLARLVEGLLDVSRIATGRLRIEPEEIDLEATLRDVVLEHRGMAERTGCTLELSSDGPLVGRWDRSRVEQIVANLLSNAIKYSAGKPIEVRLSQDDGIVSIAVVDRGLGIAAEDIERIFGRFERAVSSRQYGGLGLGLYIARQLARAHGGDISVESRLGAGATFTLRLPYWNGETESRVRALSRPILIVDDDDDVRDTVAELLGEKGFRVCTASSGRNALELARSELPSLILLDMMMPDMDGWAFVAELRKNPELASLPVIVFSAHDSTAEIAAALEVAGFLKKPFELSELIATVERSAISTGIDQGVQASKT